jgi:exodeoxyribonuclease V alpha subunit
VVQDAVAAVARDRRIVIEDLNTCFEDARVNHKAVYLAQFHACEQGVANHLKFLRDHSGSLGAADAERAARWVQRQLSIRLAQRQVQAIKAALNNKVMVITGGPGTGKTTIINAILKIYARLGARILLAAPTGRAAKRMSETTGREASTIHRLLAYSPQKRGFQKNFDHPLACDLLILDEASMVDTVLMHHLLKAVPKTAVLVMVGDVHQLPSVGPGTVLKDIIDSGVVPVVALTEIFRQARQSRIVVNAHRINRGKLPEASAKGGKSDFYFIPREDPEETLSLILDLVQRRIPEWKGLDPLADIQVLTPMHRGVVGASNLNDALQLALNPGPGGIMRGGRCLRVRDKVMQLKNNYEKEVFNGDIGRIARIDTETQQVAIRFDGRSISYDYTELDELTLAYAVSVHKAQGSEYPVVILPVLIQHYRLLQRNLIYTAVTRGRDLVVLVGTRKALAIAVGNDKTARRYTGLRQRLSR